ncbi:hypothetical protein NQ318_020069 [Aromia moschata]|uniref:Uncharacterized protein n=1 Tax=Aromia moschata TaxID=1265417 RepID=A0AAV8ZB67_9CUCU|nr:hypothetical protein NQ318_020069 [Aromia moschata]
MIDKELGLIVDKICRCCMTENENMHNLFENKPHIEGSCSVLLSEMLIACASVEVLFGDGLPYNLCDSCKKRLHNAYEFRLRCQESNCIFRELNNVESKDNIMKEENIFVQSNDISEEQGERPQLEHVLKQGRPKKKDNGFPCSFCHKMLRTKRGLQGHLRVHTGEKMSQCTNQNNSRDQRSLSSPSISESIENDIKQEKEEVEVKLEVVSAEEDSMDMEISKEYHDNLSNDNFINNVVSLRNTIKLEQQNSDVPVDSRISDRPLAVEDRNDTEDLLVAKKRVYKKNKVCHVCGASFGRLNRLVKHMTSHSSLLVHQCDKCEKAFAAEEYLKKHVKEEHVKKPYVCTVCNKSFTRSAYLISHVKVHQTGAEEGASLRCSMCDATFTSSEHLARHIKIHLMEDKRHVCVDCGKAFNRLENLKIHQRIHTGTKHTSKSHLCIYCGKEFNNSSNLVRHTRVHTGERPYSCSICGKSFTQWNDLNYHTRRHTGARPYGCNDCSARFILSRQLKQHCKTTEHSMEETPPGFQGPHRVELVIPAHEPAPIKFKRHGKSGEAVEGNATLVDSPTVEQIVEEAEEHSLDGCSQAS